MLRRFLIPIAVLWCLLLSIAAQAGGRPQACIDAHQEAKTSKNDSRYMVEMFSLCLDAAESDMERGLAFEARGKAKFGLRKYKEARRDLDKAAELLPNRARVYFLRAYALKLLGDFDGAIRDCDKAIRVAAALPSRIRPQGMGVRCEGEFGCRL
jgi:tetratricopeptide (TPR) repeat protein